MTNRFMALRCRYSGSAYVLDNWRADCSSISRSTRAGGKLTSKSSRRLMAVCGNAGRRQGFQSHGVGLLLVTRAATSGKSLESTLANSVQQGFGQNASGRVVGA